jgi:hypothetical protein
MRDVRESPTHTNPKPKEEQRKKGGEKKTKTPENQKPEKSSSRCP